MCSLRIIIGTHTALHGEMMVAEMEVCMVLLVVIIDNMLVHPVVDIMVNTAYLVVVRVGLQMIHIGHVQRDPHPLSQKDNNEGKTEKNYMQYKINLNEA